MANNHSISEFITSFGGGTRTNRFRVTGKLGDGTALDGKGGSFHIQALTLPASVVQGIPIHYRGRTVVYPGDRVYSPWKIAVLDENPRETKTGKTLYRAFHDWSKQINDHKLNTSTQTNPSLHFTSQSKINSTWSIEHLDTNGVNVIRRFKLHNCWPAIVGDMQLNMEKDNELASFMVTIVYSHFEFDPIGSN